MVNVEEFRLATGREVTQENILPLIQEALSAGRRVKDREDVSFLETICLFIQ